MQCDCQDTVWCVIMLMLMISSVTEGCLAGPLSEWRRNGEVIVFRITWFAASSRCIMLHGWSLNFDASITLQMRWLRVSELFVYQIAVLTFNVPHGIARDYLGRVVRIADLPIVPGRLAPPSAGINRLVVQTVNNRHSLFPGSRSSCLE